MILKNFCKKNIIFSACLIFSGILLLFPESASAQATYNQLVDIPGITFSQGVTGYLSGLYTFLISVVGIVAMGAIVIGGARYLTSAGNPSAIEDAKHIIYQAIYGLILALTSWVIVKEINPDILVLKNPAISMSSSAFNLGVKEPRCALPGGDGKTAATACKCIDGTDVTFTQPAPPSGPYVVSTSIAPCSVNVLNSVKSLSFTFNEALDPASVSAATVTAGLQTTPMTAFPITVAGNVITVSWTNNFSAGADQFVTITTGIKSAGGTPVDSDYKLRFTGEANFAVSCTPPLPLVITCNVACSNPALATDGKYHCLEAGVRIGWVTDPSKYTNDELKKIASNQGTSTSPFNSTQGLNYVINMEDYSNLGTNLPVEYYADGNFDADCEATDEDGDGDDDSGTMFPGWRWIAATIILPTVPICKESSTPKGITCGQKFCLYDSNGNKAETTLNYIILDNPSIPPNIP